MLAGKGAGLVGGKRLPAHHAYFGMLWDWRYRCFLSYSNRSIAQRYAPSLVPARLPVLLLANFAAVGHELATRAG